MYRILFLLLFPIAISAQTIPANRLTDWSHSGLDAVIPTQSTTVDFSTVGGVGDGVTPNDTALQNVLASATGFTIIYFPQGNWYFEAPINLPDSIVLRGAGATQTAIKFDLGGATLDGITISGYGSLTVRPASAAVSRGANEVSVDTAAYFAVGDYVYVSDIDTAWVFSPWSYGSSGQINRVDSIYGNTLVLRDQIRRNFDITNSPTVRKLNPATMCGIECMKVERLDATVFQTSNIAITYARDCWVKGVEGVNCNFGHVTITWSTNIQVCGCYFHDAFAYNTGGQGYGVIIQHASGNCLIENNCFKHLRHSMQMQAGANGNVLAYNYSEDPFWSLFPSNSCGDIAFEGNYPYANLIEGNVVQNIVVDASHGINGPDNLFFRNRVKLWGLRMSNNPASDSMIYVGNEITNTAPLMGNYALYGNGHFEYANTVQGTIVPTSTNVLPEDSYYLTAIPAWMPGWPQIGVPYVYNVGTNQAEQRFQAQMYTDCGCDSVLTGVHAQGEQNAQLGSVVPTLFAEQLIVRLDEVNKARMTITNALGEIVFVREVQNGEEVSTANLAPGIYVVTLQSGEMTQTIRTVKSR